MSAMIQKSFDKKLLANFLLQLAKFETQFETMIRNLITKKATIWEDDRETSRDFMFEVGEYFAGNRNWDKGEVDESYAAWFSSVSE